MAEVSANFRMNIAAMSTEDLLRYRRLLLSSSPECSATFTALYHAVQDELDQRGEARDGG